MANHSIYPASILSLTCGPGDMYNLEIKEVGRENIIHEEYVYTLTHMDSNPPA